MTKYGLCIPHRSQQCALNWRWWAACEHRHHAHLRSRQNAARGKPDFQDGLLMCIPRKVSTLCGIRDN